MLSKMLTLTLLLLTITFTHATQSQIPAPLKPWIPWVEKGHEHYQCPFISQAAYGEKLSHICAWPSALRLQASDKGGSFEQSWRVLTPSWLPLPGKAGNWPQQVKANGHNQSVVERNGRPSLWLDKGNYAIEGQFTWSKLPQSLPVPDSYAFIELEVNSKTVAFPRLQKGELWLGEFETEQASDDHVSVDVYRVLSDGAHIQLKTYIKLNVSGKRREQAIGKVLPPGFSLIGVDGELSAFLDPQGILHAKLQPGSWTIEVDAYAKPTLISWQHSMMGHLWPQQEVWGFVADEQFRTGKIKGGSVIDASQTQMKELYAQLPVYLLNPGEGLTYSISKRGRSEQMENRLTLKRQLWLGFDGEQYTFVDNIGGKMVDNWRLNMASPYTLASATDKDGPMLITSDTPNQHGIENRYFDVNLQARGNVAYAQELPVSGWDSAFEKVTLNLNLPPSYRLFGVFGADNAPGTWLNRWSIWNVFVVLFSAILATRFMGLGMGILTTATLVITFQESAAPIYFMVNLLLAFTLKKHLTLPSFTTLLRGYLGFSLLGFVAAALFFSVNQLRTTIHPQLERSHSVYQDDRVRKFAAPQGLTHDNQEADFLESVSNVPPQNFQESEMMRVKTSSFVRKTEVQQRYQSNTIMQAGPGIPKWSWNFYNITWTSPVTAGQNVKLIIQPAWLTRVLKVVGISLLLLWTALLLKANLRSIIAKPFIRHTAATLAALILLPIGTEQAQAASFPDENLLKQLQQRVIEAPQCSPNCALINQMTVSAQNNLLTIQLQVHALHHSAISIPLSRFWRAQTVKINGKASHSLYQQSGWTYLPIDKGITDVKLSGAIAPVEQLQLQFLDKPKQIHIEDSTQWDIIGVNHGRLNSNALEFTAKQKALPGQEQSSRYSTTAMVEVQRNLTFDSDWKVTTTVRRIAPNKGAITVKVPLLPSEQVLTSNREVTDNHVEVTIAADNIHDEVSWTSTLERTDSLTLQFDKSRDAVEHWQIVSSPLWHITHSGQPLVDGEPSDYVTYNYYPYPGESLTLEISRPNAVKGQMLAIDRAKAELNQGERAVNFQLDFNYRATRGGEHSIELPEGYKLDTIKSDGQTINAQIDKGKLSFPVSPGEHEISLTLRAEQEPPLKLTMPKVDLNAPVSNLKLTVALSENHWILWADGPVIGPAVIYWGEFLVFLLLAILLGRYRFSPLGTVSWLLLGFGLSLYSWWILATVVLCFGALTLSQYRPKTMSPFLYNTSQLGLYLLCLSTLYHLVLSIPNTLLGRPDMGITGNGSWRNNLQWFADQSSGLLPTVEVINIPILYYKAAMLLWVLWLSFALIKWCKWSWQKLSVVERWRPFPSHSKRKTKTAQDNARDEPEKEADKGIKT